ncbi:hypothetical protein ACFQLX_00085 [Streptomyces polyrhachis]|uniref:Uncharacterized protein n=1 Tax=Streptomyces polyrhachis TaxID=1282885 RepID=A0ABW2GAX9_9ACTN
MSDDKTIKRLAKEITAFSGKHGGAEGQIAHLGTMGARIALVGGDDFWGLLVAPSVAVAQAAAEAAGLSLREDFDGELAARVETGPYEWRRMAGIQLVPMRETETA